LTSPPASPTGAAFRLTIVIGSLALGGAQRILTILTNEWAARGWAITILTFDPAGLPPFFPLHPAIAVRPLGIAGDSGPSVWRAILNNIRRLAVLRRALRRSSPDLVLSFLYRTNIVAVLASRGLGVPIVIAERTNPESVVSSRWWRVLRRWTYRLADAATAQTDAAADYLRAIGQSRVIVIPNPVLEPQAGVALAAQRPLIVAMGRLSEEKRFDMLIGAFAALAGRFPDWRLVIFGEGPERKRLAALIAEHGLSERIGLPGSIADAAAALRAADIFVLSSRFEGFPNALCEAMALGVACVATDCPSGPRAIVRSGTDGLLVPNEDQAALAEGMTQLMGDADLRARLGNRAKEIVQRLSLAQILDQWDALFRQAREVETSTS
jgi:glycosyltransferase involved in cell wall biosynthesis